MSELEDGDEQRARDRAKAAFVMHLVALAYGKPAKEIFARGERGGVADKARQVAIYLTHVAFEMPLTQVAIAFRRDRSTVGWACNRVEDMRENRRFDEWIDKLEACVRAAPRPR